MSKGLTFPTQLGEITVYDNQYVSVSNMARLMELVGETAMSRIGRQYVLVLERGLYVTKSGKTVQKMITLDTFRQVLLNYFNLDNQSANELVLLLRGGAAEKKGVEMEER